jgi:hypothetical protein
VPLSRTIFGRAGPVSAILRKQDEEETLMTRLGPAARIIALCGGLGLAACSGGTASDTDATSAKGAPFGAVLSGRYEAPPANSHAGGGTAKVRYDKASRLLTWDVAFGGLTSDATAAHIDGPAAPGVNGPVVVVLTPRNMFPVTSPLHGSATLTDAQAAELAAGKWYVNIHTISNPNGELRGQLMPQ